MALLTCPDCQSQVSSEAPSCPKCGRPRSATLSGQGSRPPAPPPLPSSAQKRPSKLVLVLAGLVFLALVGICSGKKDKGGSQRLSAQGPGQGASAQTEPRAVSEESEIPWIAGVKANCAAYDAGAFVS